jgi:hypothetical protein
LGGHICDALTTTRILYMTWQPNEQNNFNNVFFEYYKFRFVYYWFCELAQSCLLKIDWQLLTPQTVKTKHLQLRGVVYNGVFQKQTSRSLYSLYHHYRSVVDIQNCHRSSVIPSFWPFVCPSVRPNVVCRN